MAQVDKKNEVEEQKSELENLLTPAKVKDFASGKNGELIQLVSIEETKSILLDMANEYKDFKITPENYKTEGKKIERKFRETRYSLQNIHENNKAVLNDAKKEEKKVFDNLIEILKDTEDRLTGELKAIQEKEKQEKELAKQIEFERVEAIQNILVGTEQFFEVLIAKAKTDEHLAEYDEKLLELRNEIPKMDEFEYKGKKLEATYMGRREEVIKQIESSKKEIADKKKFEADKKKFEEEQAKIQAEEKAKKEAEQKEKEEEEKHEAEARRKADEILAEKREKIAKIRIGILAKKGIKPNESDRQNISLMDEVEWYDFLEQTDEIIAERLKLEEEEQQKAIVEARKQWKELRDNYIALGGNKSDFNTQMPSPEQLQELKTKISELKEKNKRLKIKGVGKEIEPFKKSALDYLGNYKEMIKNVNFDYSESKSIVEGLAVRLEEVIAEVMDMK